MTERTQARTVGQAAPGGATATRPDPAAIRRSDAVTSGRATARAALDAALSGVDLTDIDRRFLSRLSQWDKRNATFVASLITRARQRGRIENALTARQRATLLAALADAMEYRTSGAAAAACWDCTNLASGLCADHARDADRARAFGDLATILSGRVPAAGVARLGAVPDFRQRAKVAS